MNAPDARSAPSRAIYGGILLVFALTVGSLFVYQIGQVVLTLLLTLLLAMIISAPVNYLARHGWGRGWALATVAGALALVAWLFGLVAAPRVRQQARQFADSLPTLIEDVEAFARRTQEALGLGVGLELDSLLQEGQELLSGEMLSATAGVGRSAATAVSFGVVALIATVYLIVRPRPVVNGFVALFPAGWRWKVRQVLGEVYWTLQRWLVGQLVAMTFIGVSSGVALWALGVPFAVLLGLFSGVISFVPFVGAVVAAIPPVLLALTDSPILAVWVILAYTAIQQVESQLIQPIVMSRAVFVHPAVVLFGILILGTLFGVVGLLLAVPLVATAQVLVRELWVERMNGVGTDPDPPDQNGNSEKSGLLRRVMSMLQKSPTHEKEGA